MSSLTIRPIVAFANALNTRLRRDEIRTSGSHSPSGLSSVVKSCVSTPKSLLSLFSGIMAVITGTSLYTRWEEFKSEEFFGKLRMLFVPTVSSIATVLPHIITGIWADESSSANPSKRSLPAYTTELRNNILKTYFNGIQTSNFLADEIYTLLHNIQNLDERTIQKARQELGLEVFQDENKVIYFQTILDNSNNLYSESSPDNSKKKTYGFRFRPVSGGDENTNKQLNNESTFELILTYTTPTDNNIFHPFTGPLSIKLKDIISLMPHSYRKHLLTQVITLNDAGIPSVNNTRIKTS